MRQTEEKKQAVRMSSVHFTLPNSSKCDLKCIKKKHYQNIIECPNSNSKVCLPVGISAVMATLTSSGGKKLQVLVCEQKAAFG